MCFLRKPFLTALALRGDSSLCMNGLLGPAVLQALSGLVKRDLLSIEIAVVPGCLGHLLPPWQVAY